VIIDFHTHIFPPKIREEREDYLRRDHAFAALYSQPEARIATAEELLASMEAAEIDRSVALGFAWSAPELCARHNDYLLEWGVRSGGRLIPFCTIQPREEDEALREGERCARAGAKGLGELRPEDQGYSLVGEGGALLAYLADRLRLALLFHVSEPVGHSYCGKGGLRLEDLWAFLVAHPETSVVAAHWGGGLLFYSLMPEVKETLRNTYFDTAASGLLYRDEIFQRASDLVGPERILLGSDFPLLTQGRQVRRVRESIPGEETQKLILGENARRLLDLAR